MFAKIKAFFASLIAKIIGLFSKKSAATPVVVPAPAPVDVVSKQATTTASQTGVSDQDRLNAAYMASGSGGQKPAGTPAGGSGSGPGKDGILHYFHNTECYAGKFTTDSLTGPTQAQFSYTSQEGDVIAPQFAWFKVDGGAESGPWNVNVGTAVDLGTSGVHTVEVRYDTPGRTIGHLITK